MKGKILFCCLLVFNSFFFNSRSQSTDRDYAKQVNAPNKCEGYAEGGQFCGEPTPYKVYFAAEFDVIPVETGTWKHESLFPEATFAEGKNSGVYFTFDLKKNRKIQYKIGVSYIQSLKVNGKVHDSTWIDWDDLSNGATLEYATSGKPNFKWGTNQLPPSFP